MTSFSVRIMFVPLVAILVTLTTALFGASFSVLLRVATLLFGVGLVVFLCRIFALSFIFR